MKLSIPKSHHDNADNKTSVTSFPRQRRGGDTARRVDPHAAAFSQHEIDGSVRVAAQQQHLEKAFGTVLQSHGADNDTDMPRAGVSPSNHFGLPQHLKTGIESLSGFDMTDVRVHHNSTKPARLNASAYTQGADIYLGPGQERHLPHEAWHVVQQKQGRVRPTANLNGTHLNTDKTLEREADTMAAQSLHGPNGRPEKKSDTMPGSRKSDVVQGKFGFEVELGLALGWSDLDDKAQDEANYSAPDTHLTTYPVAASGEGFEVHVDHNPSIDVVAGSSSIAELVTKPPIDESTADEAAVKARVKQMTDFVSDVNTETGGLDNREKLGAIAGVNSTSQKEGFLFVGGSKKGEQQLESGYMQATYAVKIEKMPQLFAEVAKPENTINPVARAAANYVSQKFSSGVALTSYLNNMEIWDFIDKAWILKTAGDTEADNIYKSAWDENVTAKLDERVPKIKAELAPLMGYFSLITNYLILGRFIKKHPENKLRKNHLGLLYYKSRMSTLRNSLSAFSRWLLDDPDLRLGTYYWLLKIGGRPDQDAQDVQEKAFPATGKISDITLFDWLNQILEGTEDKLFDKSKNDYSDEIVPYNVGKTGAQTIGAVVESRKVAPKGGFTYKPTDIEKDKYNELAEGVDQSQRKVTEWEDIAVGLWRFLKSINDID